MAEETMMTPDMEVAVLEISAMPIPVLGTSEMEPIALETVSMETVPAEMIAVETITIEPMVLAPLMETPVEMPMSEAPVEAVMVVTPMVEAPMVQNDAPAPRKERKPKFNRENGSRENSGRENVRNEMPAAEMTTGMTAEATSAATGSEAIAGDFKSLGLPEYVLNQVTDMGFSIPTPIQAQAIPIALEGRDVVGIAQTGTGKTMAFALPMASLLERGKAGLILAPTRELAAQIEEDFQKLGARTALLIGGAPMGRQIQQLRNRPDVIVATPGRLEDHMQGRTADLRNIQIAVLDEADRMLDMGFAPAIRRILDRTPSARQTMLFSATMPPEILDLAQNYLNNPVSVEVTVQGTPNADVEQELIVLHKDAKISMVEDLLHEHRGTTLVFTRTRHGARKLAKHVQDIGHTAAELHSDRTLAQRQSALRGFKNGQYRILVATDIAARGIDVKEIGLVLNYDVPEHAEDYVHRIGRTGRAGAKGRAITLVSPEQAHEVRDIERLLQKELPLAANSPLQMNRPAPRTPGEGGNRRGGPRRGGPRPGGSGGRFDGPRGGDRR